jgi:hypothetical protein
MERGCYVIEKFQDRWSISVGGTKVLLCESKKAAVRAVRQAIEALSGDLRSCVQLQADFERSVLSTELSGHLDQAKAEN